MNEVQKIANEVRNDKHAAESHKNNAFMYSKLALGAEGLQAQMV